ncbi:MAG: histone deacetylase family protein [Candidatus Cloacimonetes bacterium]|nr:histone deacetylase family protein [Candidatus Cloacimonadota bacterium]
MHPENKKRLISLGKLAETKLENGEKYLELFHTSEYIEQVKKACISGGHLDNDTIVSKQSYEAAIYAVGATIMASQTGDFALTRPPGHHAHPNHSSGFCVFNNIAIATQKLVNEGKRVLIFDFDGHLGDGTVKYFYNSDKVMYWSMHQYPAFPGGGDADEIGDGVGRGYTINVPLPQGSGDDLFMDAFNTFLPVAKEFNPDVVAVSAGFDSHHYDLLLNLRFSLNVYYKIGKLLSENFKNIFATLEGGYNIEFFPKCLLNFLEGVNNYRMRYEEQETDSTIQTFYEYEGRKHLIVQLLSKYWKNI